MWKPVRIAFAIRVGETGGNATLKFTPAVVRPVLKKMFSGQRLAMVKGLPIVGKHLLQRNIIKFGIPIVGVPTAVLVNRWTTRVVGDQAKEILRKEARIREAASRLVSSTDAREELVWVLWLVMRVDGCAKDDELLLLHHVTEAMKKAGCDESLLKELREPVELDESMVWRRIDSLEGAKKALHDAAVVAAAVDGRIVSSEISALKELAVRCGVEYDSEGIEDCRIPGDDCAAGSCACDATRGAWVRAGRPCRFVGRDRRILEAPGSSGSREPFSGAGARSRPRRSCSSEWDGRRAALRWWASPRPRAPRR